MPVSLMTLELIKNQQLGKLAYIIWISGTLLASACTSENEQFTITKMDGFPKQFEAGCSCCFSETTEDFNNKQFIYIDDYGDYEFISINGNLVVLTPDDRAKDKFTVEWKADSEHKVSVEVTRYTGILTVTSEGGVAVSKKFIGNCGC